MVATLLVGLCCPLRAAAQGGLANREATAQPDNPVREGFTLELGVGAAVTFVSTTYSTGCFSTTGDCATEGDVTETESFGGFAPLSVGIGGFLSKRVALEFRVAGTSYFEREENWVHAFAGPAIQVWPGDRVMLGAGVGAGTFGENPLLSRRGALTSRAYSGVALSLRGGYAFLTNRDHALRCSLEFLPGFYDNRRVVGSALSLEWQLL